MNLQTVSSCCTMQILGAMGIEATTEAIKATEARKTHGVTSLLAITKERSQKVTEESLVKCGYKKIQSYQSNSYHRGTVNVWFKEVPQSAVTYENEE